MQLQYFKKSASIISIAFSDIVTFVCSKYIATRGTTKYIINGRIAELMIKFLKFVSKPKDIK